MTPGQIVAPKVELIKAQVAKATPNNPVLKGWASYSPCDEDGIIRECLSCIASSAALSQAFVEIGCADGLENKTHQLLLDGFSGVWIDGAPEKIGAIEKALGNTVFEKLWVLEAMVTQESADLLARRALQFLGVSSVDFFSLDIDGNDAHVLPSFLGQLNPKLVCVEYNAKFPPPTRLVMRYDQKRSWSGDDYFGVSLQSWVDLLTKWNYTLVCCNLSGANAFFVRNDLLGGFSSYSLELLYQPPRYFLIDTQKGHGASLRWARQLLHNEEGRAKFVPALLAAPRFAIHAGTDEFISGDIARNAVWEPFESKVFSRLCQPGTTVLDLGANIGWYSVLAATLVGESGCVFAFEPDGDNARLLEMNAAISDRYGVIKIYRHAVGDSNTETLFYKSDTNLGDHRLFSDGSSRQAYPVSRTTLDSFFSEEGRKLPDLVKSDTQGSEAKIFKGAKGLFAKGWRPLMILEYWPFGLTNSGDDPLKFWEELTGLGYQTFEVSEANPRLVRVDSARLKSRLATDISSSSGGFINLLCIPEGVDCLARLSELIDRGQN